MTMKIALISASENPIPATRGGATQTMMTHLIDVNEERKENEFIVLTYSEPLAIKESRRYTNTAFYFYEPKSWQDSVQSIFWRALRKLTFERVYLRSHFIKWCVSIINREKCDVVILTGQCFLTQYLRNLYKGKLILHMHIDRLNRELKSTERIINCCDGLFAISDFCKRRMVEVVQNAEEKIIVVKNTIDTDHFTASGRGQSAYRIRKEIGLQPGQKLISYCGRINKDKGVLELVKAVKQLDDKQLKLIIIGSSVYAGSKADSFVKKVQRESETIKGGTIFTGYIAQSDLPNYISACDIAVVPSILGEAAGNVIIEALACGVPVIASSQGGIPEYADLRACRLVDYGDNFIDRLAKQIQELVYDEKLRKSLKSHAREVALQYNKYNYYEHFIKGIISILQR